MGSFKEYVVGVVIEYRIVVVKGYGYFKLRVEMS